MMHEIHIDVSR